MPQQTLHTARLTLVPLADEHLEWELELDSDPEVMCDLSGRASTRTVEGVADGEVEYEMTREQWERRAT